MTRTSNRVILLALVGMAGASPAWAQMRGGGGGPTVVAVPLDKVPVGSWAEYSVKRGDQPPRKIRQALVGKEKDAFVLETKSETQRGDMISHYVIAADPTKEGGVKKVVMQMGDADPMEMPVGGMGPPPGAGGGGDQGRGGGFRGGPRFVKPEAGKLVGKETIKTAAGSFAAEHYKGENPRGGTFDYWVSKDVAPLGLVKLQMQMQGGPNGEGGGEMVMELAAKGKGAKAEVTKPAKPFDPEAMRGRFGGGGGRGQGGGRGPGGPGGPGAGGPPPAKP
jgi:hypothetical protein